MEGEKSSKYLFNLEKHNISNKTWTKIKCKDGSYKGDIASILKEQKSFFEELLKSEGTYETEANSLLQSVDARLTEDEKLFCEKDVTQEEIHKVIKLLKHNKSLGDDGIIAEFYQIYWYLIHDELTRVILNALENDSLSKSQYNQGSKCPSLPGLTHWVNPGLPGLGFKPYLGKVGNTWE